MGLVASVAATAPAFELGARFDLSNLDFSRERAGTATTLPGDASNWGVSVTGSQTLGDNLGIELSYADDPILRRVGYTRISYVDQFFSIAVGPFFGLFNSSSTLLQSGLTTSVALFIPGIATFQVRSDNSLGGRLSVAGDYIQERSDISLGFFLPNVIPTLHLRTKRFTQKTAAGEVMDRFTEYALTTDIYQKNVPYRVMLTFGYQDISRQFIEAATTTHAYGSVILGVKATAEVFRAMELIADLESSVYTFGTDALLGTTSADTFLFRLSTGISLDLDAF